MGAIEALKDTSLNLGESITATISSGKTGEEYYFGQVLTGEFGEQITLTRNSAQAPAPKLRITSSDGSYDRTFSFKYG